ncbi:MAG: glycosyltransferase family 2 protein [Candidatus Saccharimonadales bacterium]
MQQSALAAFDVGLRQVNDDFSSVITWQSLSIVLPAYNEEVVIAQTVQDCLRTLRRYCPNTEVIVVDDGSRDNTGAIADELASRDARVVAVHNRPNRGYGGALLAGFDAARGELLFFMDSDGQFNIDQIQDLLRVAAEKPGTVVLGYRAHRRDPFFRRLNAGAWKRLVRLLLGLKGVRDIDCAFKLFPARTIRACQVQAEGAMVNTEFLVKMQRMHVPMVQVPVAHFARTHGTATGANLSVILKAFRELMSLRLRLHHWQPPTLS